MVDVEPAEDETLVLRFQHAAPPGRVKHQRVPLEETGPLGIAHLDRPAELAAGHAFSLDDVRAPARLHELGHHPVDMGLLDRDLFRHDVRHGGQVVGRGSGSSLGGRGAHSHPMVRRCTRGGRGNHQV